MITSKELRLRRRRLLKETERSVHSKIVALTHRDVVVLAELRRAARLDRVLNAPPAVLDLLGSVVRSLCYHETVRVGSVLYVRTEDLL